MKSHNFVAVAVNGSIDLKKFNNIAVDSQLDPSDVKFIQLDGGGIFVFSMGCLVCWNVPAEKRAELIAEYTKSEIMAAPLRSTFDDFTVFEKPDEKSKIGFSTAQISNLTDSRAEVVAYILAQSATMQKYEGLVGQVWGEMEGLVDLMRTKGQVTMHPKRLQRAVGELMHLRNNVVSALHVLDRPDLIWDDALMDSLFEDLRSTFDLPERFVSLRFKLDTVQDNLELLLDASRDSRAFVVEVGILAVIVFEVGVYLHELFYL